jgi:hypothetical protein
MSSPEELKARLKELMADPENMVCLDCKDKRPMWASLVVPPPNAPFTTAIGCFCCFQCSGAHRRMGTHICFVRSTNLDECTFYPSCLMSAMNLFGVRDEYFWIVISSFCV